MNLSARRQGWQPMSCVVVSAGSIVCRAGRLWMRKAFILTLALAGSAILAGSVAVLGVRAPADPGAAQPVWTETKWPFPLDQWGIGRAFVCEHADCGARVDVYVRPKIGYCNCATGVADDAELERVADTALIGPQTRPLYTGRPVKVGWMQGLS